MARRKKIGIKVKAKIIEESYKVGSIVGEIAKKYGISKELLYSWRTKYKKNDGSEIDITNAESCGNNKFIEVTVNDDPVEEDNDRKETVLQRVSLEYEGVTVVIEGWHCKKILSEIIKIMEVAI